jgi:NAD(P)H-flavin reductase
MTRVVVEPAPELLSTYVSPGQYLEMRVAGETGYFVIASDPGQQPWELVMRAGGGASDVVLVLPAGAPIEVTGALGPGFPMEEARAEALVIVLQGTGIAAGPPLVRSRIRDGQAGRTFVFAGVRGEPDLPLYDEMLSWMSSGVDVTVCLSLSESAPITPLRIERGYAQDVLIARVTTGTLPLRAGDRSLVFAVGAASVAQALRAAAPALGIRPDQVRTNH